VDVDVRYLLRQRLEHQRLLHILVQQLRLPVVVVEHKQESEITARNFQVMVEVTLLILVALMIGMVVAVVREQLLSETMELISLLKVELVVPAVLEKQIPL
jgi:hypothetical protein